MNSNDDIHSTAAMPMSHTAHEPASTALSKPSAIKAIARMAEPQPLVQRELNDRRLINRDDASRPQADAFREIRTRLLAG